MRDDWARRTREHADMDALLRAQAQATSMDEADEIAALHALAELDALYGSDAELQHLASLADEHAWSPAPIINLTADANESGPTSGPCGAAAGSCALAASLAAPASSGRPVPPSPRRPSAAAWLARRA